MCSVENLGCAVLLITTNPPVTIASGWIQNECEKPPSAENSSVWDG